MKTKKRKMSKRHVPQHIYCETFGINYYISYGISRKDFKDSFKYNIGGRIRCLREGKTVHIIEKNLIWIWTREKDLPNLSHEVFHAVDITLDSRGVRLNDGSCEVYAYQISMLMRKILEAENDA